VNAQRNALKSETLKPERVALLNAIGFQAVIRNHTESWNGNYNKLEAYHAHNGHCNGLPRYKVDCALAQWIRNQRKALRNGRLKPERVARLNAIGFQAEPYSHSEQWNQKFIKLEAYHAHNGHFNVPRGYEADTTLRQWVGTQRMALKNGTLKADRVVRLSRIRFQ